MGDSAPQDEVFGSPEQQAVLRRGRALYELMSDNLDISYYGRGVGSMRTRPEGRALVERLVALQGVSNVFGVPLTEADDEQAALEEMGLSITRYTTFEGGADALARAEAIVAEQPFPHDLTLRLIDADSPVDHLAVLAEVSLRAGVLPIHGGVLRGCLRPGVGAVAIDAAGRPVSCAASAAFAHPDHPQHGDMAWWGMLATDPNRQGERLALILGAQVMLAMHRRFGLARFFTGVQPGNAPSEAVCRKTGLTEAPSVILTTVDPAVLDGGKMTK